MKKIIHPLIQINASNRKSAIVRILVLLSVILILFLACSHPNKETKSLTKDQEVKNELTLEQETALEAFNTLQVRTDKMNRLFSTFAGFDQPCYPPDTNLIISQAEFREAMKQFVESNCQNLTLTEREKLATASVLAQEEYKVSLCLDNPSAVSFEKGVPMEGTWVLPNFLGRRDVLIVW